MTQAGKITLPGRVLARVLLTRVLLTAIMLYRLTFSMFLGRHCRFLPTCSDYAATAIAQHGPGRGSLLSLKRIARCHPWGGSGYDPVPGREP